MISRLPIPSTEVNSFDLTTQNICQTQNIGLAESCIMFVEDMLEMDIQTTSCQKMVIFLIECASQEWIFATLSHALEYIARPENLRQCAAEQRTYKRYQDLLDEMHAEIIPIPLFEDDSDMDEYLLDQFGAVDTDRHTHSHLNGYLMALCEVYWKIQTPEFVVRDHLRRKLYTSQWGHNNLGDFCEVDPTPSADDEPLLAASQLEVNDGEVLASTALKGSVASSPKVLVTKSPSKFKKFLDDIPTPPIRSPLSQSHVVQWSTSIHPAACSSTSIITPTSSTASSPTMKATSAKKRRAAEIDEMDETANVDVDGSREPVAKRGRTDAHAPSSSIGTDVYTESSSGPLVSASVPAVASPEPASPTWFDEELEDFDLLVEEPNAEFDLDDCVGGESFLQDDDGSYY